MTSVLPYLPWAIGLAYILVCEIVDTQDRLKRLEKIPWAWRLVNNRLLRVALLIVCLGFLGKDIANVIPAPIPSPFTIKAPPPPPPVQLPPKIVYLPPKTPTTEPKTASDFAELQFGFYPGGPNDTFPKTAEDILMKDGTVTVELAVRGGPSKTAIDGSLWIVLCDACKFAKEPDGFTTVTGLDEHQRLMSFQRVLANIYLPKMTVTIIPPKGQTRFQVAFKYACENCAPNPPLQTLNIHAIP